MGVLSLHINYGIMEEEKQELVESSSSMEKGLCSSKSISTEKLELTVDQVIEEYVGSFGFSQLLHVFLVSLAWIFDSQSTLVTIFTDAQPDEWRCIGSSSACGLGSDFTSGNAASVCGLKPGTWEWIGGNSSSIIAEWGLVCDRKFLAAVPASLYFLGSLVGRCSNFTFILLYSITYLCLQCCIFPEKKFDIRIN